MNGLIIYASKYGSTAEYAALMSGELGAAAVRAGEVDAKDLDDAGYLVLGSPVYGYSILPEMERFLSDVGDSVAGKPCGAFVVCGDTLWNPEAGEGGGKNLEKLTGLIPVPPVATAVLGGRMRMEDLDEEDGPRIRAFHDRIGRAATGFDRMDPAAATAFCRRLELALGRADQGKP